MRSWRPPLQHSTADGGAQRRCSGIGFDADAPSSVSSGSNSLGAGRHATGKGRRSLLAISHRISAHISSKIRTSRNPSVPGANKNARLELDLSRSLSRPAAPASCAQPSSAASTPACQKSPMFGAWCGIFAIGAIGTFVYAATEPILARPADIRHFLAEIDELFYLCSNAITENKNV